METQNLVISFDYSWFLAKNLAYAECRIMKFHYRNSSNEHVHRIQFREELSGPVRAVFDHANRLNAGPDLSVDKSSSEKSDFCLGLSSFWTCIPLVCSLQGRERRCFPIDCIRVPVLKWGFWVMWNNFLDQNLTLFSPFQDLKCQLDVTRIEK